MSTLWRGLLIAWLGGTSPLVPRDEAAPAADPARFEQPGDAAGGPLAGDAQPARPPRPRRG